MRDFFERFATSPSKTLFCALLAWTGGTALRSFLPASAAETIVVCMCVSFAGMTIAWRRGVRIVALALLCVVVMGCAALRFDVAVERTAPPIGLDYRGIVLNDAHPDVSGTTVRIERPHEASSGKPVGLNAFSVRTAESVVMPAGTSVRWRCKAPPKTFGTTGSCIAAQIVVEAFPENPLTTTVIAVRRKLRMAARAALPEPDASLLLGFVIGDRNGIPKDVSESYRDTGVSHVLAASGSNVGWVVGLVAVLAAVHRMARRSALLRIAAAAIFFAAIVGGDPPVMRAAIVACVALAAEALGRRAHHGIALAFASALMLAIDPLLIRDSVAFRLSFAAVIGLATLAKPLESVMARIPERFDLRKTLAETSAASLATLPIVLHDFGRLPVSTLFANAAIVPVMPWLVASGALAIGTAIIWPPLSMPFAFAFSVGVRIANAIIAWFARAMPAADLRIGTTAAVAMVAVILALRHALVVRMRARRPPPEVYD